jgi:holin-like protein
LQGLAYLLLLQSAGELLSRGLGLPFPGPVVGMALLLPALYWKAVRKPVALCAELFVPVGVGVMTHLSLVNQYGLRLGVVIVLSTWLGLAATVLALRAMGALAQTEPRGTPAP